MSLTVRRPVPATVTMLQLRLALEAAGLLGAVATWIATQPAAVRIAWEFATEVASDDPWLEDARVALGLTPSQRDDILRAAASFVR